MQITKRQLGFTVIELIVVIVVIGILATVVLVAYNGIQSRANVALLQSELKKADTQLSLNFADNNERFPDTLEEANGGKGLSFTGDAELFYTARNDEVPTDFCLTAVIGTYVYHIQHSGIPVEGYCPEHVPVGIADVPTIISSADSQTQITISWEAVDGADSYKLEYSTDETFATKTTVNDITDVTYAVDGLSSDTQYNFRLYAVNSAGESEPSDVVQESTLPTAPAGAPVLACTVNSPTQVTITWSAVSGSTSYQIDRSTASTFTSVVTTSDINDTSLIVTSLSAGTRYYFRGFANNISGQGPASSSINCITTISAPDSPSVAVSIPGAVRSASSGPWAKTYQGDPTSGNWYYASGSVSSSTCAAGTTRQQRARIQYNSPTTWGAWTSYTTSSTFYAINPNSGYGIRFQVQTRCYTSAYTSSGSSYGYGCRWRSTNSTSCSGF